MPFSNIADVRGQWAKIKGKEAEVGAQFFFRSFKVAGVQDAFTPFKGKAVKESDLTTHGKIVMDFMRDRLVEGDAADEAMKEYVASHKQKPGLSPTLVSSVKGVLVDVFVEHGLDRAVMDTFVGDFLNTMTGLW
ncbi:hypothetical protein ScPMuIL_018071 [Solemya velum]